MEVTLHCFTYNKAFSKMLFNSCEARPGFFLCIFSSLTCLKKSVFSKRDLLQWKVPASLSLFLKSEKIPTLLYLGKGLVYRPFCDFQPVPSAYQPWAQILNHGRACTWALLLRNSYCWGRLGVTDFCVFIRLSTQDLINMMDRLILSFFFPSAPVLSI